MSQRILKFRAWWKDTKELIPDFMEEYSLESLNSEMFIVSQWTGLIDRHGKEIWEGDIVRYTHKNLDHPVDFNVVFFEGQFLQDKKGYPEPSVWYDWTDMEVIGNIYENPELLK